MSSVSNSNSSESHGTNGYFCYGYDSCSITGPLNTPWWKADLQNSYFVSTLIVKPRDDGYDFSNIEIRFGNSPTISQNPILATYLGSTPPAGTVLTFKAPHPMEGRYLSIQTFTFPFAVGMCEVQIIEA
ncbi:fucolectin-4-like [Macrobrachium nipponense]|uniref:fucolectin-4-like n=1 Tax=Macrobrachium nipponense TaxID=159736 RepID=UPI0030C87C8C